MATMVAGAKAPAVDWEVPEQVGLWSDAWRRFKRNKVAVLGLVLVGLLVLDAVAVFLLGLTGHYLWADPLKQDVNNIFANPSLAHPFGQDELGRDVLARLLAGAEISIQIGLLTQAIILVVGGLVGLTAGYFGGWVDNLLMRFTDVMYAFPDLLFIIVVVAALGKSLLSIFVAISIVNWVGLARLIRGQVLQLREKEFIEGARASGSAPMKIILKHLLPNSLGPVIVSLTFGIPQAIFLEAVLSYLGAGLPPPTPSWGVMAQDGYDAIAATPNLVLFPAVAIAITMLSFTFIGDGLRDALDPRMRK
ncbi:MAG: ABC transporter permease [Candidatus Dormibacteria bacterium]